ncbi:hypothetical protein C5167_050134 [Papaver somniferum]|uniref:Uncharacterized protein n=1 Tax=Papaver somniferum TaxID=3469 RepID=A0A4Y7KMS2_PAPSO|nr:ankyrin-3-like [Papaver somniferum]RZC74654.1 hypothetical protein C5167_050134 [Papaver somniferum]
MTVFSVSHNYHNGGGKKQQVVPVDYESEVSQRLIDAIHSEHDRNDVKLVCDMISDPCVDINFIGGVYLKTRKTEVILKDEISNEVKIEYQEFKSDVTALFLASHSGNLTLVRKLLSAGADVNQQLFRGFATTAAVREGHLEILEILLKAGASQLACEEALLEASYHGWPRLTELLMGSDMIRSHVAVHALVTACSRGFVDVVDKLTKSGVDPNSTDRVLLQSSVPSLHTNADCTALVAAVVSRQATVVRQLLQVGVKTDSKVKLGAWSWDTNAVEELKVGAGLAEPYPITWCAVEYYEASGSILRLLLKNHSPDTQHYGRTLLHHAILCNNAKALDLLLKFGADIECIVKTTRKASFHPIHMAARLGFKRIVQCLVDAGCHLNSLTDSGDTALMISTRGKHEECLRVLGSTGADFGLVNNAGQSASSIAASSRWSLSFQRVLLDIIRSGKTIKTSNHSIFSPLMFVALAGDVDTLKILIAQSDTDIDYQDNSGQSALMATAKEGHVEAFRLLVYAGADVKLRNKSGETAIGLSERNHNCDLFEKVLLEYALEKGNHGARGFYVLHCAARRGDLAAVRLLTNRGYDVNLPDAEDYTPIMLAAREGHGSMCELLISCGARCDLKTARGETALSLARKNGAGSEAEMVILDQLSRVLVLNGARIRKHTKGGKGAPHGKTMKMIAAAGILCWGKSSRRNVLCRDAVIGCSPVFRKNRERKGYDGNEKGVFRIMTTKNKDFHFVCESAVEAELWVRGIKLVTREAIFGKKQSETER